MAKVQFITPEKAAPIEAPCDRGHIQSRAYFNRETDSLHLHVHELTADGVLRLDTPRTDTLVYVWMGAVAVRDVRLTARSSLIVERGATAAISAVDDAATVLFFAPKEQGPGARSARLWLLPRERVPCNRDLGGQGLAGGALHADASPASCHLWLHENDFYVGGNPVAVHSHSEDEIIFVRDGELRVGRRTFGPGAALAIAANTKYGFQVGPTGLSFVNFRASAPTYKSSDGTHSMDEAEFWRSQTGPPEGKIFGALSSVIAVSVGLGPVVAGLIFDRTHSYRFFLLGGIPVALAAALLILSLRAYPDDPGQLSESAPAVS